MRMISRILNKSVKWRMRHYTWDRYKFRFKHRKILKEIKEHNKNLPGLANSKLALNCSGGLSVIQYPPNCPYGWHELGDYCWALGVAFDDSPEAVKKFYEHCPCDGGIKFVDELYKKERERK